MKKYIVQVVKSLLTPQLVKQEKSILKVDLQERHIQNTKLLPNRFELLKLLPKNGVAAELGVAKGDFSEEILRITVPQKLHLIDFWGSERYNQSLKQKVLTKFERQIADEIIEINLGLSTTVVDSFENGYFDWIYIDTDHTYQTTKQELERYAPKMKPNGIIAGHDYVIGNWVSMARYGVVEAVHEFCLKYDWEIIYLTTEMSDFPSFAIRKISN